MALSKAYTIISTLTFSEMKGRYRNTWAGFIWVIINPILMFSVQALVFKHILRIDMERYYIFLLGGLLPWIFISSTLNMTCNAFITNREILLSFQVNPLAILASKVLDNFINFISPFLILLFILFWQNEFNIIGLTLLPFLMLLLLIGTFLISLFFATLQVYFRDAQFILSFALSILFFLTPIFYPAEMVPENLQWLVTINPIYALIRPFQIALYEGNLSLMGEAIIRSILFNLSIFITCIWFWRNKRNELYLYM
jgi:lipopolysaccharide transport system permease protein